LVNGGSRFVTGQSGASCIARAIASKKTVLPAEQLRPKLARHRARWKAHQGKVDQSRLVFIDETWIKTNMAPLRGWGPRRKRLIAHVPHGHWKTMTFLAALRRDRIDAPWVLNGPLNGEAFKTYVRNELLKTLKPGDIVVLDNLGSHKGKTVRKMIRDAGAHLMFLPPYSPDLNPIEQVFAKIKHLEAGDGTNRGKSSRPARQPPRHHPAKRMLKLLQSGRICGNLNATCSRVLILQASHSLPDERTEYLIKDRLSFSSCAFMG
jgi:DDE superfamily endonuclease